MRRSLHFVPGGNERMIQKALTLPADGLILDLEDAVAPDLKPATRPIVRRWLETLDFGARERWIRMNPIASEHAEADLEETIAGRPHGYVVPKPRRAEDIRREELRPLLEDGVTDPEAIERATRRIVDRILQGPSAALRRGDLALDPQHAHLLRAIFGLAEADGGPEGGAHGRP